MRAPRRFAADTGGATAVEFALLAPFFLAVVFAAFMLGFIEYSRAQLDQAAEIAKRAVLTGEATNLAQLTPVIAGSIGGLVDPAAISVDIKPYAVLANMKTANPTLQYDDQGALANAWHKNYGKPGAIMVLQLIYQLPAFAGPMFAFSNLPNGKYELVATQVFVRE